MTGSLKLMLGDAMSILARRTFSPSLYLPSRISSKSARFSSMLLFLYGLSLPGSFKVPLYSLICSAFRSHTKALPFFISSMAASYILSKYSEAQSLLSHWNPSHFTSSSMESTYSTSSFTGFVSSYLKLHIPPYFCAVEKFKHIDLACPI
ncbi:hypothetical protein SDC9_145931 [bioreactor metagenome]|uniref:Uncharacterized protein n=1 Tax=bioreactor metagenome TaxID=1076179 RepID=A0A645EDS3_9ZZZZ